MAVHAGVNIRNDVNSSVPINESPPASSAGCMRNINGDASPARHYARDV
jgi:hypothetical protein